MNTLKIIGLDVSKSSVCGCVLTEKPTDLRHFYYGYKFYNFGANKNDLNKLLELSPDIAILEPTGTNYSRIWCEHLSRNGIKVLLVGHKELRHYRAHQLNLPDKDDSADALALACYWFDYGQSPSRFIRSYNTDTSRVRELVLKLEHLNRAQSPIINRLRQDLAWQFPEVALVQSKRGINGDVPMLWGWMCYQRESSRYDRIYRESIGLGLEQSTRDRAAIICSLQMQEMDIENELSLILRSPQFIRYLEVFEKFGFGFRLSAIILAYIYPIENFLIDGKPEVRFHRGKNSGKPTKRHLSLRRFQKILGLAPSMEASGDKKAVKTNNGSRLCRKALWQWVFTALEVKKRRQANNPITSALCAFLDAEKAAGKPIRLIRCRVAAKAVKMLFRELVNY